jgi:hypothetical protein
MKDKKDKNVAVPYNPIQDMMMGSMPGLPSIIQNAMPVALPQMNYTDNPVSMIFGNFKRKRVATATELEAQIAENSNRALVAKFNSIHEVVTFSSKVANTLGEYEHNRDMRRVEFHKGHAEIKLLELEAKEKEANIQQTNFQTALIAQEVEIAKIETQIKMKQLKEILNDDNVIDA